MWYVHEMESMTNDVIETLAAERAERISAAARGEYVTPPTSPFSDETYEYYALSFGQEVVVQPVSLLNRGRRENVSDWAAQAICKGMTRIFFADPSLKGSKQLLQIARAKEICKGCPVMKECGDYAIANQEFAGVWGGMDEDERRRKINARY
jgi:WhiB family transcriptional regulator, redox-sensing transcriptional regulator